MSEQEKLAYEKLKEECNNLKKYILSGAVIGSVPEDYLKLMVAGHFDIDIEKVEKMSVEWFNKAVAYVAANKEAQLIAFENGRDFKKQGLSMDERVMLAGYRKPPQDSTK